MKITTCTRLKYYLPYYEFKGFMSLYISIAKSVFIMAHMFFLVLREPPDCRASNGPDPVFSEPRTDRALN